MKRMGATGREDPFWIGQLLAVSIALYVATRSVQSPSNWGTGGDSAVLIFLLPFLAFPLVGALIASKRPGNPIGWICLDAGIIWMVVLISTSYGVYGLVVRARHKKKL